MMRGHIVLGTLLLPVAACSTDPYCAGLPRPGIAVSVVDAATGASLDAGVAVTVTDLRSGESRTGPLVPPPGSVDAPPTSIAHDRPGRYLVEIEAEGYLPWSAEVVVSSTDGVCPETRTTTVVAGLRR